MERNVITTVIGTINLTEIALMEDMLEVYIPITSVSENVQSIIEENIERAKEEYQHNVLDELYKDIKWSDAGVNTEYIQLHIIIEEKSFKYELCYDFCDKENELISTRLTLDVDLSEHVTELKKLILQTLIEKFFQESVTENFWKVVNHRQPSITKERVYYDES